MSRKPNLPEIDPGLDRRQFLACTALLGGTLAAGGLTGLLPLGAQAASGDQAGPYVTCLPENQIYSVCQQCNTNCGNKVKIVDGRVAKIDGNPYNPWNLTPQVAYDTPAAEAAIIDGTLCPKGYAGIQTLYDPYRIVKVLKRAGKRGENTWKTIPFDQALTEIVEGGDLFGEGPVEGMKKLIVQRDPKLMEAMAKDAAEVGAKKLGLEEFKAKYADHLQDLIDPDHPDLGPKNNQVCYYWGRQKDGRKDFVERFFQHNLGTANFHGHTPVCQGSLYFTCKAMSDQFVEGKFTAGSKFYWQADTGNAEFILFVGASPYEANYGPPLRAGKVTRSIVEEGRKIAVVDPRCSKAAARAWKWLPVKPNGVGALGMAMIRWIIDNARYDARYLANANKAAAKADNEPTWSQGPWLVKCDAEGRPGTFLRGSDLGLTVQKRPKAGGEGEWDFDALLVMQGETPVPFDPNDDKAAVEGDLLVDRELNGVRVKSVLQIYRDAASARTLAEWAELAGVAEADIVELAREFTSHGKRAVADLHRGVSQHTCGFYNVVVWMTVNVLMGNHDWMGGLSKSTTYDIKGNKEGMPYDLGKNRNKLKPWGVSIIRHGIAYDKTTLFSGYPAKRVWYPFSSDIYQEVIPSAGNMYPYQLKCLFLYMGTPVYSLPAGHALIEILSDPKKIPLFITSDITVGETSTYADYVFPDLTYLERWEFSGSHPSQVCKVAPVRQPAAAPMTGTVTVFGQEMPISLESMLLGLAEKLGLPGFGDEAFGPGLALKREEDMYLRMVANIAFGEKADGSEKVPAASPEEIDIFLKARRHLPKTVFDAERWKKVIGEALWPHAVYVLNRGGKFQDYAKAYKDGQLANKYGKMVGIYFENLHKTKHSMTGKPYHPHGDWLPSPTDCAGNLIDDDKDGDDLTLITYKAVTQTKSRTVGDYWLQAAYPENFVEVAAADAKRLGLKDGDLVRVVSASNPEGVWKLGNGRTKPVVGKVRVREGLRPGVVAFSLGHGHWAYGAGEWTIDGQAVPADPRRATGIHANAAMRLDPVLKNTGLVDTTGGSAVFYQSPVKLVKV
jgi:anaerobic selenocysteine-containing dehydrogenase